MRSTTGAPHISSAASLTFNGTGELCCMRDYEVCAFERRREPESMTATSRVTVVSVFHNRAELVEVSVRSLLDQTLQDLEILLVDDGSTDDTLERLRSFDDPRVRVITHANMGFTKAIRAAVAEAGGDYVAIHGSGDISRPVRLERQKALLDEMPEVGLVGCAHLYKGLKIGPDTLDIIGAGDILARLRVKNPFAHGEVMFRKSVYDEVGGYDPSFIYGQDSDLWLRMSPSCAFAIIPDILYERYNPYNSIRRDARKFYYQQKLAQAQLHKAEQSGRYNTVDGDLQLSARLDLIDREFARRFYDRGIGALLSRDHEGAEYVLRQAWRERRDFRGAKALMLSLLCAVPLGGSLAFNAVRAKRRLIPR